MPSRTFFTALAEEGLLALDPAVLAWRWDINRIRAKGYTDNVGSKAFNLELSRERAHSVMKWLVDHGVDESRLSAKGYGKSHPVADDRTEAGRAENRRVEIVRTNVKG